VKTAKALTHGLGVGGKKKTKKFKLRNQRIGFSRGMAKVGKNGTGKTTKEGAFRGGGTPRVGGRRFWKKVISKWGRARTPGTKGL